MQSPGGWVEPGQAPEFDEYTLVIRGMVRVTHAAIADAAFDPEGEQLVVVKDRGRQLRKHAPVTPALGDRSIDGASGRQAQISYRMGCSLSGRRGHRHSRKHRAARCANDNFERMVLVPIS